LTKFQKIKPILEEIKKSSVLISGGSGDKDRYEMRKPELYWKLGMAVNEVSEKKSIPKEQRREWSRKYFKNLDKEIFGSVRKEPLCYLAYKYFDAFETEDYFMKIADAAGNAFGNLRRKRIDDLLNVLSKKNSDLTPKKQEKLIEKLCEKDYSRKEFLEIKSSFFQKSNKNSISWPSFDEAYQELSNDVFYAMESDKKKRDEFRKTLDDVSITQMRYLAQLIKISEDHFEQAYEKVKSVLSKKIKAKNSMLIIIETLKICVKDEKLKKKLLNHVNLYELSELQTSLHAVQTEKNFKDYVERQKSLEKMFE